MSRVLVLSVLLTAASAGAQGQDLFVPDRLSLADALRLAAERNPTLAAARNAVEIAEAQRADARLRPNPVISMDSEGHPLTVRVDQEIELAGRRRLRTETAAASVSAAEASFADVRRRLDLDVRRAYFTVVLAKADLDVARASLDEIDKVIALNRARYRQGEISGVEVRRIQVERLRFVDDLFAADLALRNARGTLLALFNAPELNHSFEVTENLTPSDPAAAPPTPTMLDPASLREQALASRPDLLAARETVRRADTETRLQRALRTPNLTVGGGYRRNFGTDAVVFGVAVPLPLFNRNQGGIAHAEAEKRQAENRATATAAEVRLDVQQAVNSVDVSRARVDYIEREYLTPARESRDIVLASYRLGTANLIDFLDAQRAFRDTLRTYNQALYDQRLSQFELDAATASQLGGSRDLAGSKDPALRTVTAMDWSGSIDPALRTVTAMDWSGSKDPALRTNGLGEPGSVRRRIGGSLDPPASTCLRSGGSSDPPNAARERQVRR